MAAARLGLRCHVFSPERGSPGLRRGAARRPAADYDDVEALEPFADDVDVITYEFENVPAETAAILAARRPVLPDRTSCAITQDRLVEKDFVAELGIGTAPYARCRHADELHAALASIGLPAVLKTRRFGYDGKGQAMIRDGDDRRCGLATIVGASPRSSKASCRSSARSRWSPRAAPTAQVECFDVAENEHRDHILQVSTRAGAAIADAARREAERIAATHRRARSTMSACSRSRCSWCARTARAAGQRDRAARPQFRPLDASTAASVSQFEQHIRAIAGWPLGRPVRHGARRDDQPDRRRGRRLARTGSRVPGARVHLYGKGEARPGRKMGHVTGDAARPRAPCRRRAAGWSRHSRLRGVAPQSLFPIGGHSTLSGTSAP